MRRLALAIACIAAFVAPAAASTNRPLTMREAHVAVARHYTADAVIAWCHRVNASRVRCGLREDGGFSIPDVRTGGGTYRWVAYATRHRNGHVSVKDDAAFYGL